jgi:hypothetical protein
MKVIFATCKDTSTDPKAGTEFINSTETDSIFQLLLQFFLLY